jgi:choline dehydrogenase-like flavoprotein
MSVLDVRKLPHLKHLDTDVCIVGAGAAGITLAHELSGSPLDVCLIESGGFTADPQIQSLCDLVSTGYALRENYMSRARYFGGSCNLWAGRSMLLSELDLRRRDWVPDSGWPISYVDLARHYPRAAEILELPGVSEPDFADYRSRMSDDERTFFADGEFLPTTSLWATSPQRFGSDFRKSLSRAANVRLLLHASVTGVNLNEAGASVESLTAATLEGGSVQIRARHYVLACGGLENARLLLVSRDRQRNGIGNGFDLVGRYFMDHPRAVFGTVHLPAGRRLQALRGRPLRDGKLQLGIGPSADMQRREGLLNHYVTLESQTSGYAEARYQAMVQTAKVLLRKGHAGSRWDFRSMKASDLPNMIYLLSPKELMPHQLYRWYVAAREAIPRRPSPKTYIAVYFCEQPPDRDSRVTLSDEVDRLGMPRLKLHWQIGASVIRSMMRIQELLAQQLQATGVGHLEPGDEDIRFTDASHHMGTTRMSAGPQSGVVDAHCRVHGVQNLYVAGSSVFPCAGHANPTITIVALSLRLAAHLRALRVSVPGAQ